MKALSLWQPWASAIALGSKRVETRHWSTHYRGPLVIHAAKRRNRLDFEEFTNDYQWCGAMGWPFVADVDKVWADMPFGALVATCTLLGIRRSETFSHQEIQMPRVPDRPNGTLFAWCEDNMGNFAGGRFGWVLGDIKPLATPIPYTGHQGLFDVPDELLR